MLGSVRVLRVMVRPRQVLIHPNQAVKQRQLAHLIVETVENFYGRGDEVENALKRKRGYWLRMLQRLVEER